MVYSKARELAGFASVRLRRRVYVILLRNGEYTFLTRPYLLEKDKVVDTLGKQYGD